METSQKNMLNGVIQVQKVVRIHVICCILYS